MEIEGDEGVKKQCVAGSMNGKTKRRISSILRYKNGSLKIGTAECVVVL